MYAESCVILSKEVIGY